MKTITRLLSIAAAILGVFILSKASEGTPYKLLTGAILADAGLMILVGTLIYSIHGKTRVSMPSAILAVNRLSARAAEVSAGQRDFYVYVFSESIDRHIANMPGDNKKAVLRMAKGLGYTSQKDRNKPFAISSTLCPS